jgi:hypothetical protein
MSIVLFFFFSFSVVFVLPRKEGVVDMHFEASRGVF